MTDYRDNLDGGYHASRHGYSHQREGGGMGGIIIAIGIIGFVFLILALFAGTGGDTPAVAPDGTTQSAPAAPAAETSTTTPAPSGDPAPAGTTTPSQ